MFSLKDKGTRFYK